MPKLPATPMEVNKTRTERREEEAKRQREMATDIYLQVKHELLGRPCKLPPRISLMADGWALFSAIRKTYLRVMKKGSESQWLSSFDSQMHEELFKALLLVSLKSVVMDGAAIRLWKVGGRYSSLQKELRDENTKAVELARIRQVSLESCTAYIFRTNRYSVSRGTVQYQHLRQEVPPTW